MTSHHSEGKRKQFSIEFRRSRSDHLAASKYFRHKDQIRQVYRLLLHTNSESVFPYTEPGSRQSLIGMSFIDNQYAKLSDHKQNKVCERSEVAW